MSKKFICVVVGVIIFVAGYICGKNYKAKSYGEAFLEGRKDAEADMKTKDTAETKDSTVYFI